MSLKDEERVMTELNDLLYHPKINKEVKMKYPVVLFYQNPDKDIIPVQLDFDLETKEEAMKYAGEILSLMRPDAKWLVFVEVREEEGDEFRILCQLQPRKKDDVVIAYDLAGQTNFELDLKTARFKKI